MISQSAISPSDGANLALNCPAVNTLPTSRLIFAAGAIVALAASITVIGIPTCSLSLALPTVIV